ncbi:MAG: hypothetical protein KZQ78_11815 [Candidatus Thiodiazotropha sp. (ex Ustalcina ferruginea)]|nr:hypothetical protein [Candidatus Thiodiazotropha sp. (ex Ustalcina ferruginea)]
MVIDRVVNAKVGYVGWAWVLLVCMLMLTACAGGIKPSSNEERVRAKVEAYWAAMVAKDYPVAYAHLAPGFRTRVSEDAYMKRFAGKTTFHEAKISKVDCDIEVCNLVVDSQHTIHAIPPFDMDLDTAGAWEQKWIYSGNAWWLLPKK